MTGHQSLYPIARYLCAPPVKTQVCCLFCRIRAATPCLLTLCPVRDMVYSGWTVKTQKVQGKYRVILQCKMTFLLSAGFGFAGAGLQQWVQPLAGCEEPGRVVARRTGEQSRGNYTMRTELYVWEQGKELLALRWQPLFSLHVFTSLHWPHSVFLSSLILHSFLFSGCNGISKICLEGVLIKWGY